MLHLHRSERADALADALGALLAEALDDPFQHEVVAVPTRGIERWLSQRLATVLGSAPGRGDGVWANVEFPFPERVLAAALDAARPPAASASPGAAPASTRALPADPWAPERAVWPLVDVVAGCAGEPWMALLAAHLERGGGAQRFAALRHVADLFDRYGVHRPAMIRAWAEGADVDASGDRLAEDLIWQPQLWRRLSAAIGSPSAAERLVEACAALRRGEVEIDLPARFSLFGLTRLPPSYLEVLRAIAASREVHLFLLHPSPSLWSAIEEHGDGAPSPLRRAEDASVTAAQHPLLASWGRDAREMQLVLQAGEEHDAPDGGDAPGRGPGPGGVHHESPRPSSATLLARLQTDIRENRRPPGEAAPGAPDERLLLDPGDDSVQVHDCHGRGRQVEVVRDAILHLLADDATLEPRDVVVMCPDIESWAPLIRAAFDVGASPTPAGSPTTGAPISPPDDAGEIGGDVGDPAPSAPVDLRARLADRSLRQTNPLFGLVTVLLELAGSRVTASQVLDLAAMAPVRRRFGFDDAELARLGQWVGESGVRWGIDAAHRAPFGLARLAANTWRAGLDRLLLGVAVSEEHGQLVGGVLPLEDVASSEIELAGRFCELLDRLAATLDELSPPDGFPATRPVDEWGEAIRAALDRLALCSEPERWQRLQVDRLLADVAAEATENLAPGGDAGEPGLDADEPGLDAGRTAHGAAPERPDAPGEARRPRPSVPIELAELRTLLADRLRGRPTRANFRTGHLTICTLVPMRSVPHRVVCLLGMDDGAFPRHAVDDGDDLVSRDPWVGDRDPRGEDRQLLLDAVLAAGEHLVVTYRGRDERTNAARPPCVPVGELLDVIDATARVEQKQHPGASAPRPSSAVEHVVVRHPLQPFDDRCFTPGALVAGVPWSFDAVNLAGARSAAGERHGRDAFLEGPLPPLEEEVVELADLVRFVRRPVGELLRRRLGLRLNEQAEEPLDAMPIELDGLERYAVGERMLEARMSGLSRRVCEDAERARGTLPPGVLAAAVLETCGPIVDALLATWRREVPAEAARRTLDVRVALPGGQSVVGSVAGVHGELLCSVSYSRLSAARRLESWVRLVALAATRPQLTGAITIGRSAAARADGGDEGIAVSRLLPPADPLGLLADLVDLYRRAMREPLPLYCRTSEAWAAARRRGRRAARNVGASGEETLGGAGDARHGDEGAANGAGVDPSRVAGRVWRAGGGADRGIPDEGDEDAHLLVLGAASFATLLEELPRPDESGPGWASDEPTRLGRYARRLWDPLLECERVEER